MSTTSLHVHPYEKRWIIFSIVLLIVFTAAVAIAAFALGIQVPSPEQRVDPRTVAVDPNSPWSNPGLREIAPGRYEAYILAQTWQFQPREIRVPVGSRVTFYVTSKDVQHTFKIQDTNINVQVVPGQVSKLTVTFKKPGTYPFICSEYCGVGHAGMFGQIIVTP
ncbi:MAG: cytochrome c oxidase subunit II [Chloroflexi bacterium]|jgi:cytochrome c oxidase subunit 2|nr:cytochrome c oxidase subunit II [Chloroflexota bacterium]